MQYIQYKQTLVFPLDKWEYNKDTNVYTLIEAAPFKVVAKWQKDHSVDTLVVAEVDNVEAFKEWNNQLPKKERAQLLVESKVPNITKYYLEV